MIGELMSKSWLANRRNFVRRMFDMPGMDAMSETPVVTILGERQTGKTEMIIDRMIRHAQEGETVAYAGYTLCNADSVLRSIEDLNPDGMVKIRRTNGDKAIEFASGGSIKFMSAARADGDVVALDWIDRREVDRVVKSGRASLVYHVPLES